MITRPPRALRARLDHEILVTLDPEIRAARGPASTVLIAGPRRRAPQACLPEGPARVPLPCAARAKRLGCCGPGACPGSPLTRSCDGFPGGQSLSPPRGRLREAVGSRYQHFGRLVTSRRLAPRHTSGSDFGDGAWSLLRASATTLSSSAMCEGVGLSRTIFSHCRLISAPRWFSAGLATRV